MCINTMAAHSLAWVMQSSTFLPSIITHYTNYSLPSTINSRVCIEIRWRYTMQLLHRVQYQYSLAQLSHPQIRHQKIRRLGRRLGIGLGTLGRAFITISIDLRDHHRQEWNHQAICHSLSDACLHSLRELNSLYTSRMTVSNSQPFTAGTEHCSIFILN